MSDRDQLILDNLDLARRLARRIYHYSPVISYEDLFQSACIGLIKAADTWIEGPAPFQFWATLKIRGEMQEELRRMPWVVRLPQGEKPLQPVPLEEICDIPDEPQIDNADEVRELLSRLSSTTREMMRRYFGLGDCEARTGAQIGLAMNYSHTQVHNRINDAIELGRNIARKEERHRVHHD